MKKAYVRIAWKTLMTKTMIEFKETEYGIDAYLKKHLEDTLFPKLRKDWGLDKVDIYFSLIKALNIQLESIKAELADRENEVCFKIDELTGVSFGHGERGLGAVATASFCNRSFVLAEGFGVGEAFFLFPPPAEALDQERRG